MNKIINYSTIVILIVSLYGYISQYHKSYKKKNFYFFDDNFIILNGISCSIICIYKFIIRDYIFLVYNALLTLFYGLIYLHKYLFI